MKSADNQKDKIQNNFEAYSESSIHRSSHDRENPYTMILNDLTRDHNISPECRWLVTYLLTNVDKWTIRQKDIAKHVNNFWGRDKVAKVFDEALESGYMMREEYTENNLKRYKYYVAERPIFKKSFRYTDFQETENQGSLEIPLEESLKENTTYSPKEPVPGSCHAPLAPDAPQKKVEVKKNEVAAALALFFFQILQHENPNMKQPNLKAWTKSIERILRIDKRDPEKVRELMLWSIGDEFWHKNILSPDKLRKHYDRLLIEKTKQKNYKQKYSKKEDKPKKFLPNEKIPEKYEPAPKGYMDELLRGLKHDA